MHLTENIELYTGKHVIIRFDGEKCIHSRNCVLSRPDVFRPNVEGPWISPDSASAEAVAAVARNCPSGAITYEPVGNIAPETPPLVNVIRVLENGPLAVSADLEIEGQPRITRATLCRCGASEHKPYCDASHHTANFRATGEPEGDNSAPLEKRDGPLKVKPSPNGPLIVENSVEIVTGTGRTVTRTQKAALCRCGHSSRKPFCDGTHQRVGFNTK